MDSAGGSAPYHVQEISPSTSNPFILYPWPPQSQQIDDYNRNIHLPINPVCTPKNIEQELQKGITPLISPSTSDTFTKIPSLFMKVFVNGVEVTFDINPCTDVSTILYSTKELLFPHLMIQYDGTVFENFDGTTMASLGFIDGLTVNYEFLTVTNKRLFVVSDAESQVIGSEWLSALYLWPSVSQQIDDDNRSLCLPINPVCTPLAISPEAILDNVDQEIKKELNSLIRDKNLSLQSPLRATPVEPAAFANSTIFSDGGNHFTNLEEDHFWQ